MSHGFRLLAVSLLALPVFAQGRVWNVSFGGDINVAIAQAADGDLILVGPGTNYRPFTLNKGLTILGTQAGISTGACIVENLAAGQNAVIQGLDVGAHFFPGQFIVRNNLGRVLLDRVIVAPGPSQRNPAVLIHNSVQVHLQRVRASGGPALEVIDSTVVATDCSLGSGFAAASGFGTPALSATRANVLVSRGTLLGPTAVFNFPTLGTEAVTATDSALTFLGDASTMITVGFIAPNALAVSAVVANGGSVTLDPNVTVVSSGGAPPIGGSAPVVRMRLPSVSVQGAPPGGTLRVDVFSAAGDGVLVLPGLSADRLPMGLLGFWLDPMLFIVAGVGVQGANEHFLLDLSLPPDLNLAFPAWAVQAVSGNVTTGFRLSNPVVFALN